MECVCVLSGCVNVSVDESRTERSSEERMESGSAGVRLESGGDKE